MGYDGAVAPSQRRESVRYTGVWLPGGCLYDPGVNETADLGMRARMYNTVPAYRGTGQDLAHRF